MEFHEFSFKIRLKYSFFLAFLAFLGKVCGNFNENLDKAFTKLPQSINQISLQQFSIKFYQNPLSNLHQTKPNFSKLKQPKHNENADELM
jgi:hypothetical protein